MSKIEINETAPDFVLEDYAGKKQSLYDILEKRHVVLVLNRGFS